MCARLCDFFSISGSCISRGICYRGELRWERNIKATNIALQDSKALLDLLVKVRLGAKDNMFDHDLLI